MTTVSGQLVQYEHFAMSGTDMCVIDKPTTGKFVGAVFTKILDSNNIDRTDRVIGFNVAPHWDSELGIEDDTKLDIGAILSYNPDDQITYPLTLTEGYYIVQKTLDFEVNVVWMEILDETGMPIEFVEGVYDIETNTATFDVPDEYNGYIGKIMATDAPEPNPDVVKYMTIVVIG